MSTLSTTPIAAVKTRQSRWLPMLAPSLTDFFFLALLVWLFLAGGGKMLLGDGDTGWHIRTGDYILQNHAVPRTDLFTFTKPGEPWFAWEWLTDLGFAWLHRGWGVKAVALAAGVALVGSATLLFGRMLWSGGNLFFSLGVALLANGATLVHFLARPHVFTFVLLAVSLWLLARDRRSPDWVVWLLVPITAAWVNIHGGFLALLVSLALMAGGHLLEWMAAGRAPSNLYFLKRYTAVGAACGLATLINPYGYKLHQHILSYMQSSFVLDTVEEFQSPKFRGENMLMFEALLFAGIALAGTLLVKKKFVEALPILFWAQASLTSVRHAPIFVIVCAPILVEELTAGWNRWSGDKSKTSVVGILRDLGNEFSRSSVRMTVWAPILIGLFFVSMTRGDAETWPKDFPKAKFPIALIDQFEGKIAPLSGQKPRIFTSDQWADYLTYRFYPRIRIFVDGRSDFFGPELGKEYVHLAGGHYEWAKILDRYRIDTAIVPLDWPLAELLKRSPDWRLIKDDGAAILFERRTPVLMESKVSAESSSSSQRSPVP